MPQIADRLPEVWPPEKYIQKLLCRTEVFLSEITVHRKSSDLVGIRKIHLLCCHQYIFRILPELRGVLCERRAAAVPEDGRPEAS